MAESTNIARPYARALFEFAKVGGADIAAWERDLNLLSVIGSDAQFLRISRDPRVTDAELTAAICDIAAQVQSAKLPAPVVNLIKLVVHNKRIAALPAIAMLFGELRAAAENTRAAVIISAVELTQAQQIQFNQVLGKKLGQTVQLTFEVDAALIGGAVIRVGDRVIDGSVRGQLKKLKAAVTH